MYGQDLSYIHDAAFGDLSREVSRVLLTLLRDGGHITGVVVDLGCGTGVLANEIAAAGLDVVGVDISPSMIAIAQSRLPDACFRVGSLHDFDLPPCVAVCAVGEALSYLGPDEARIDVRRLYSRIWHALEPGGTFLFDVVVTGQREPMSYRASRSGPDWAVEAAVTEDVTRSVIARSPRNGSKERMSAARPRCTGFRCSRGPSSTMRSPAAGSAWRWMQPIVE